MAADVIRMDMRQPESQDAPAPQPVVLVVNPTPWEDMRRYQCYTRKAYLNRGALFNNGCRCYLPHIILLCTLGSFFLFIGFPIVSMGITTGLFILAMGGILLGLGVFFISTAKKQYNRLPSDHPDRIKYAARNLHDLAVSSPVAYTVPSLQNQVMANPTAMGGQVYLMPLPPGSYVSTPGGANHSQVPLILPPGHTVPRRSYNPEDDPPPPYSDVVHNV